MKVGNHTLNFQTLTKVLGKTRRVKSPIQDQLNSSPVAGSHNSRDSRDPCSHSLSLESRAEESSEVSRLYYTTIYYQAGLD